MKRRVLALIICFTITIAFWGCSAASDDIKPTTGVIPVTDSLEMSQPPETTAEAASEGPVPEYMQPVDFVWQPYVMSDEFIQAYGDEFATQFKSMVDAFLAYEGTFSCSSIENAEAINTAAACCFPLLRMDTLRVEYDESRNVGTLVYLWTEDEHMAGIEQFENTITQFITSCVKRSDDEGTTAMAIYMAYSRMITYDYSALDNEVMVDLSSYRGLTQYSGICQTFGPAYAYLCLQMGINAVSAGSLSTDDTAHDWTLVKLNGLYYYMDTTYENGEGGFGLKYFGMNTVERVNAGNYIEEYINVGGTNLIWGPDINVTDERFTSLRSAYYAELDRENNQVCYTDIDGKEWTFKLD